MIDDALRPEASLLPMLAQAVRTDSLKLLRLPGLIVAAVIFPVVLFTFLGLAHVNGREAGISAGPYLLVSFATFATTNAMLATFGLGLSMERGLKLDVLVRAAPMPPLVYFIAKVVTALWLALLTLVVLFGFGILVGRVSLPLDRLAVLVGLELVGAIPFMAMGFALAYLASVEVANAILNLLFLLLGFASGLLVPISQLPGAVQAVAPYLPTYRYAELSWSVLGARSSPPAVSLAWLAGYTVVFTLVAVFAYSREQRSKFG